MKILHLLIALLFSFSAIAAEPKHNSTLPVEITSDKLEILQTNKKAIFTGKVEAIQGDLKLNSDTMLVYYSQTTDKIGKTQSSVSKVETKGNVRLKTQKENAKSDKGLFDVEKNIITLTGNVSLQSGKNVVNGEKMVYNLTTGQSRMISGAGNSGTNSKKQRVRGVFAPSG